MIEDLQDEMQQEEPVKKEKPHRRGHFLFLAFIVWLVYATILIMVSLPKIVVAIREANLTETIESLKEQRLASQSRDAKLCFVIPKSDGSTSFVICTQRIRRTGASEYHDVIEGLLDGPKQEAFSSGAISCISKGTTLIGLTVSSGTAFVNLSESFTSSGSTWGPGGLETACQQITRTLQALDTSITDVVILVNGEELSL
ncbi:MAG: GerMN domain-containing protein [Spirochaetales bacterium]|nr:GerMN domain-containing protein [Spirochaetales bacterium]